ncbi:MAG TPA: hypothetical protein VFG20_04795 [Planctomycetaceae bacterium]|jgi:hypothetical protein|nr:hypothetical protein [Planctomycetaceae bacterium]
MTLPLLLALFATATVIAVWGTVFGLIAEEAVTRARGWALAAVGLAVGIAACGSWHDSQAARVISTIVIVLGSRPLLLIERRPIITTTSADRSPS